MKSTVEHISQNITDLYKVNHKESYAAWLQYKNIDNQALANEYKQIFGSLAVLGNSLVLESAKKELLLGISSMLEMEPKSSSEVNQAGLVLATSETYDDLVDVDLDQLNDDGYVIKTVTSSESNKIFLVGKKDSGVLYAAFHLLRLMQNGENLQHLDIIENPKNQLRMLNQWDNMDGSIERG